MTEPLTQAPASKPRVPGPVILVAVLNFVTTLTLGAMSMVALAGLIFGNFMGLHDFITREMTQYSATPNFSYGVNFILGVVFGFSLMATLFFLFVGIGLLAGKAPAWYIQVAMSVIGVFAFPVGTILNALILFLFFRQSIRDFFKV